MYSFLSYLPFHNDFSVQRPSFILVHCLQKGAPSLLGPLSSTVIQITHLKITFLLLKRTSPKARQKKTVYILLSSLLPKGMHPFLSCKVSPAITVCACPCSCLELYNCFTALTVIIQYPPENPSALITGLPTQTLQIIHQRKGLSRRKMKRK